MNRRRTSLAGSPVLIGAATALIALVAVVLSYNANKGLPFITTYDINAEVADAKKLTTSVDVRIGGKRVGQVSDIEAMKAKDGRYYSKLSLKLDRTVAELPVDTKLRIRPKSIIGAKFVELYPGRSKRTLAAGGTIQEAETSASVDLDEVTRLFDANLRRSYRQVIKESANALAGRGSSLNEGIDAVPPVLTSGTRFLGTLADPATGLSGFIRGLDATTQAVLPATTNLGGLFAAAAPTLRAIGAENDANGQTLQLQPSVEDATISASRVAAPVLRDAAALTKELRPGVRELPRTVRALDRAVDRGVPILRRAPVLGTQLQATLRSVDRTLQRQSFGDALTLLTPTFNELVPPFQLLHTQQVKCNYVGLFARNASSAGSAGDENGNWLRIGLVVSADQTLRSPNPDPRLHYQVYPDNDQGPNGEGGCAVGSENYTPGKVIGRVPGQVSGANVRTSAPAGTPKGPR
jgi:virulence factor Mce-like protein